MLHRCPDHLSHPFNDYNFDNRDGDDDERKDVICASRRCWWCGWRRQRLGWCITWQYGVQEFWRFFLYCIGFSIFFIVFVSHIFPIPFLYHLSFCPTSYILYILLCCIILLGYIHSFVTFSFNWSSHWIYLSCVMY